MTNESKQSGFYGLGIVPNILAALDKLGFVTPTPIQERSIPAAIEGKDMIGLAQTGTGKTLAFGIPMLQAALRGKQGLVILPTRELAFQVEETLQKIGMSLGLRTALVIGGASMDRQVQMLRRGPAIIIGTPGRIIDHMNQKSISLGKVGILVLDEADRMLDMGFAPQLNRILKEVPSTAAGRQTMLFSATMPPEISQLANAYMQLPLRIEVAISGKTAENVTQELFFIAKPDKPRLLEKLLGDYRGSVLVFSRTKHGAKKIAREVRAQGHTAAELHSNKSLNQRREALDGFKNGKYRVLVATDIAARGIDVKGIELVVNYDLPTNAEDYVHRIGRTARAGAAGHAISFAEPNQRRDVQDIERLIRTTLPFSKVPVLPPARFVPAPADDDFKPSFRGRGAGYGRSSGSRTPSSSPRPYGPSRGPAPRPYGSAPRPPLRSSYGASQGRPQGGAPRRFPPRSSGGAARRPFGSRPHRPA